MRLMCRKGRKCRMHSLLKKLGDKNKSIGQIITNNEDSELELVRAQ